MDSNKGSVMKSALSGKCPRCGQGSLYNGFLKIADRCDVCGLDFSFADSGDGPAVFVMTIVGFMAMGGVLYTEFVYEPPLWVLPLIWGPVTIILCLAFLYWLKGALIAQQFLTKAEQGHISTVEPDDQH
ncbi:Uncharacterized conserved protein, DUF983 family [Cohaesibacter sp. ES.047]|uniref:DUF983 domain-containing protein n=1 Tax=Cohaesibacter sp. ES.047 TaxID=1798205 RepID=UPI000BB8A22D|nr:DUF983 domain-containing protein [Cohaesibacter sp. ES.047]SNY92040.1 Uncharacterized conserved protein, DUF983 family [Cohaesibacter sp. ES.047]